MTIMSILTDVFGLFDDGVRVLSPPGTSTTMEYLCEASIYVASAQKPDGTRILLDYLCQIPERGYHCGCEGIIRILLRKKYFEKFRISMKDTAEDTKKLVKKILEGLTDKNTEDQRKELIEMLNSGL